MAGDDSRDDGERTRIGGLPPGIPKPAQPAAAPALPSSAAEEPAERTVLAPARPPDVPPMPAPPSARASAVAAAASDDPGERTTIAPARPPGIPAAAAAPAPTGEGGDRTQVRSAPPPAAVRSAPPSAESVAPSPPRAEVTVGAPPRRPSSPDDEERTVVLAPRKVESTMRLERVAPKGEAETVVLDRPSLLLGRGHGCDVKLRTPTASREHAKLFFRNGQWMIAGVEGKSFYVDGKRQTGGEVALRGGMQLRLGDDEFEVVDTAGGAPSRSGGGLWARLTAFVRGLFGRRT